MALVPGGTSWQHRAVPPMRFPILFTGLNKAMVVVGIRPSSSDVEVDGDTIAVRMGYAFRARIPQASLRTAEADHGRVAGWGVHGWRGRWLVNGSSGNLVRLELDPPARAHVLGVPVRLRQLRVSMVDPDGFLGALTP
jgi:hypothetical protein